MHPRRCAFLAVLVVAFAACVGAGREAQSVTATPTAGHSNAALEGPPMVRLRIGDAPATKPVVHPAFGKAALVLRFPEECAGRRLDLVVERVEAGVKQPWLSITPTVRTDGTLPLAGLEAGTYVVTAVRDGAPRLVGAAEVAAAQTIEVSLRVPAAMPQR